MPTPPYTGLGRGAPPGATGELAPTMETGAMAQRVLIVEDEPHIVESLTFVLGREGFDVTSVLDGEAAVERLRHNPPDLMILDVMIPRLNGFEVLKLAKSDPGLQRIPVIVLTAKGQVQDR